MKKAFCLFLCLIMMLTLLASCNNEIPTEEPETQSPPKDTQSPAVETARGWKDIPDHDYSEDAEFVIMSRDCATWGSVQDVLPNVEGEAASVLQQAVWERNYMVEERYGVVISTVPVTFDSMPSQIRLAEAAGSHDFDLYTVPAFKAGPLILQESFTNLYSIESDVNFKDSWWDVSVNESLEVYGILYGTVGDATFTDKWTTDLIFFNKSLLENYGLATEEEMYDLALSGNWDLATMDTYSKAIQNDLDGDEWFDVADGDIWGFAADGEGVDSLIKSCGLKVFDISDGDAVSCYYGDGRDNAIKIVEKIFEVMRKSAAGFPFEGKTDVASGGQEAIINAFSNNELLFYAAQGDRPFQKFRDVQGLSYGVLPMPKATAEQDRYYTQMLPFGLNLWAIPAHADDAVKSLIIMNALNCAGEETVAPKYFDVMIPRVSQDEKAMAVMNLAYDSRVVYQEDLHNHYLGDNYIKLIQYETPLISNWENNETAYFKKMNQVLIYYGSHLW